MPVNSKLKIKKVMSFGRSTLGRKFCENGLQTSASTTKLETYEHPKSSDGSDTDSNTSGYLSSSSFESSGEEERLVVNKQKIFNVWSKWSERAEIPRNSTPVQPSEFAAYKSRTSKCVDSSLISIKKDFSKQIKIEESPETDSFWDIKTPKVHKSCSESDVRRRCDVAKRDTGSEIDVRKRHASTGSQDWKRKPFLTMSDSRLDARTRDTESTRSYTALPRYRVKVDADPVTNKLAQQLADSFSDSGVSVDESMSEFLSNVDRQNLASFLNFYDRMTSGPAYEKARRNPNNYEAVYY